MQQMMTRDGRLRKVYRHEWPGFLNRLISGNTWRGLEEPAKTRTDSRIRWTVKYTILCWVMMAWSIQGQMEERFREGRETLTKMFYRRRRCGETYTGLVKASHRIGGHRRFHRFWKRLRKTIAKRVGDAWSSYGWILFAVDGSRGDAPRTKPNEEKLGTAREKSHPQWWLTWLVHLPTQLIWDWRQGPGGSSERRHFKKMLRTLPQNSLIVADIGFGGFEFLSQLSEANVSFLIRCGGNTTLLVENTRSEIERKGDVRYVYLWPRNQRRQEPLQLRLIVVRKKGKPVYLLTNVLQTQRLSRKVAGEFYEARWGVEVEFRGLKQTMERRKILTRTPGPGGVELAANVVGLALLTLYAAMAMGAKVARLSLAAALKAIRWAIESLRHNESCKKLLQLLREALIDNYERHSSKQARDWPHKRKQKSPGPPKLRRLVGGEKRRLYARLSM